MATPTYTKSGNKATTPATLDKKVFGVKATSHQLLKDAYVAYLAEGRSSGAKTKKRGEVRGGGRKPWRQKGTGNARFGSSRNPIWRGGGIAFGPTGEENHTRKLNQKAKNQAIRQALSMAAAEDKIAIIETFDCKDGKVKPTVELLKKIGATGNILIVVTEKDQLVERATRNLPNVKAVQATYLNVFDTLNADKVVICAKSLETISQWLSITKTPTKESK